MRNSPLTLEQIASLYTERAAARYGSELVSQLEHAQQCVQLARAEGAGEELAAAAFLHDIGHLAARRPLLVGREIDDLHQYVAVPLLRGLFGPAVLEPIRLHVEAKRYLCHAESGYWERLSPASKHSLEAPGRAVRRGRGGGVPRAAIRPRCAPPAALGRSRQSSRRAGSPAGPRRPPSGGRGGLS